MFASDPATSSSCCPAWPSRSFPGISPGFGGLTCDTLSVRSHSSNWGRGRHGETKIPSQSMRGTFTLVMKNGGFRPQELMDLRWKDLEIRDVGRISETKYREEVEELESDGIDVIGDLDKTSNEWSSSPEELGRVERLICYITVTSSKTKQTREVPTKLGSVIIRWKQYIDKYLDDHNIKKEITGNDYVFGNIRNECKPYPYPMYSKIWCQIRRSVKDRLEGHKFSNHPYTIYSMRSTFIENHLINRLDLFLLSRISGHDPKVLLKHYERIDIRLRSEEITNLPFGKRSKEDIKIEII